MVISWIRSRSRTVITGGNMLKLIDIFSKVALFAVLASLSACTFVLAPKVHETPVFSVVQQGVTRAVVESEFDNAIEEQRVLIAYKPVVKVWYQYYRRLPAPKQPTELEKLEYSAFGFEEVRFFVVYNKEGHVIDFSQPKPVGISPYRI